MSASLDEPSYSVAAAVRITGLSAHVLRAWERRYGAVIPARTPGGTRRYSAAQIERLRLLAAAVAAGHPIREAARLSDREIERRLEALRPQPMAPLAEILAAVARLDAREVERLVALQLAVMGPRVFARTVATPLLREVGEGWERGELSVAAEHLASATARSVLGAALRGLGPSAALQPILFSTPAGERHELGALMAAVCAAGAGAHAVYLGPDLPVPELAGAVVRLGAAGVALSVVGLEESAASVYLAELRAALPSEVLLWIGGQKSGAFESIPGIERLDDLEALERRLSSPRWRAERVS